MQQVKNSDFGKKVASTTTKTKDAVKDTMKKSGKAIKNGYEKVKESEFAKKTKQHMDDVRQKFTKRSAAVQSRESVSIVCSNPPIEIDLRYYCICNKNRN